MPLVGACFFWVCMAVTDKASNATHPLTTIMHNAFIVALLERKKQERNRQYREGFSSGSCLTLPACVLFSCRETEHSVRECSVIRYQTGVWQRGIKRSPSMLHMLDHRPARLGTIAT